MDRKQVDFAFRVFELNPTDPAKSSAEMSVYIKQNYLDHGWEIMSTAIPQVSANTVFLAISLVRCDEVPDVVSEAGSIGKIVDTGPTEGTKKK